MMDRLLPEPHPKFVAECTLGRLAKWLRMAGFDTLYDPQPPKVARIKAYAAQPPRIVLTRTLTVYRNIEHIPLIFLRADHPMDQMRIVIRRCDLLRAQCRPFSRCLKCNRRVEACDVDDVRERVPEHVLLNHVNFRCCPQCRGIFWPGSHLQRGLDLIDAWFQSQIEKRIS